MKRRRRMWVGDCKQRRGIICSLLEMRNGHVERERAAVCLTNMLTQSMKFLIPKCT